MTSLKSPGRLNDIYAGGRKRIFIGLLSLTCISVCCVFLLLLILPWISDYSWFFRHVCIIGGCLGIFLFSWLCLILIFHIHTKKQLPGICAIRHLLIGLFLPLMEIVGKIFGINKEIVRRSFIKVNNELTLANLQPVPANRILLLLPHCIQASKCGRRLTYSLDNCQHCGKCQMGELLEFAREFKIHIAVATGGTIARRIVVQCRPKLIVAVACERDLTSGIQDCYPIPVFGVLNERPNGPCMDTRVPLTALKITLVHLISHNGCILPHAEMPCPNQVETQS